MITNVYPVALPGAVHETLMWANEVAHLQTILCVKG